MHCFSAVTRCTKSNGQSLIHERLKVSQWATVDSISKWHNRIFIFVSLKERHNFGTRKLWLKSCRANLPHRPFKVIQMAKKEVWPILLSILKLRRAIIPPFSLGTLLSRSGPCHWHVFFFLFFFLLCNSISQPVVYFIAPLWRIKSWCSVSPQLSCMFVTHSPC